MNRLFKFRVWDPKAKCMLYPDAMAFYDKSKQYMGYFTDSIGVFDDDVDVMQLTGLKDDNGKDIWEGDIVRICNDCGHFRNKIVEYEHGSFLPGRWIAGGDNSFEVIGNKFENLELIQCPPKYV